MTLGEKIASERRKLNYTQEQLAQLLGVSRQSVSKWESDLAYPETEKLIQLGKLFDCSMDYLLREEITEKDYSTPPPPAPQGHVFQLSENAKAIALFVVCRFIILPATPTAFLLLEFGLGVFLPSGSKPGAFALWGFYLWDIYHLVCCLLDFFPLVIFLWD